MCGEHDVARVAHWYGAGSSPHVRGARAFCTAPASSAGDHPRMCGEHIEIPHGHVGLQGSSPHVRGAPVVADELRELGGSSPHVRGARLDDLEGRNGDGIIPACAGSTPRNRASSAPSWDHPRMCGEHVAQMMHMAFREGSSPHVRGAPGDGYQLTYARGIIPACAGSTMRPTWFDRSLKGSSPHVRGAPRVKAERSRHGRDHPRMCGEH